MDSRTLLARTSRGTVLYKYNDGFLVCGPDGFCNYCNDLYRADELMSQLDRNIDHQYSSGFHEIMH